MNELTNKAITCCNCGWGFFDREEFNTHSCVEMMEPAHDLRCLTTEDGKEWLKEPKCIPTCDVLLSTN